MRFEISEVLNRDQVMELVYGNSSSPKSILGRHMVATGQVITAYHPDAVSMEVIDSDGVCHEMDQIERQPVFSAFFPAKRLFHYQIRMSFADGNTYISEDPYSYDSMIDQKEEMAFTDGKWLDAYRKLGAHPVKRSGVEGTNFAIWAPEARRVSVVGDFNYWNGMIYPMQRHPDTGIFELFLPRVEPGRFYKFEIKDYKGEIYQVGDPFAVMGEKKVGGASRVLNLRQFEWKDTRWMSSRSRGRTGKIRSVCEVYPPLLRFPEEKVTEILRQEKHSHVLLANPVKAEKEKAWVDRVEFLGSFKSFYDKNTPDRMRGAIAQYHANQVGVLLEITPDFLKEGIMNFAGMSTGFSDGLREAYRTGNNEDFFRLVNEYPPLFDYCLSLLAFWAGEYHIDGFAFTGFRGHAHHDSGEFLSANLLERTPGEDNTVLLLHKLIATIREANGDIIFISDILNIGFESSGWTDYYWNDMIRVYTGRYIKTSEKKKREYYYLLGLAMMRENFRDAILLLNDDNPESLVNMTVDSPHQNEYDRISERKLRYGFLMGVPGIKAWAFQSLEHPKVRAYISALLHIYRNFPALNEYDPQRAPAQIVNASDAESLVISFIRCSPVRRDNLLFVCNFSEKMHVDYRVGVPAKGKYELILTSDSIEFGGETVSDQQIVEAEEFSFDLMPWSITFSIPGKSVFIFKF